MDSLLFLQHRAGDRKLRNRGVLVSSQAGCLCFWSVTGPTHTYGEWDRERRVDAESIFQREMHQKLKGIKSHSMREAEAPKCASSWQAEMDLQTPRAVTVRLNCWLGLLPVPFLAAHNYVFFQIPSVFSGVGFMHCDRCICVRSCLVVWASQGAFMWVCRYLSIHAYF